jgi:hypothetical protein
MTKKPKSGSSTTRKTNDGSLPRTKRTTKARADVEASQEASPKVSRKKRDTKETSKPNGQLGTKKNRSKPTTAN